MQDPDTDEVAAADDMFSHGAAYPEENGKIRRRPCASCAFVESDESVRPAHISLVALERATADYDDFLCHCADANGEVYTCAGWAARFGENLTDKTRKEDA